jgi:hypothetical protein
MTDRPQSCVSLLCLDYVQEGQKLLGTYVG